MSSLPSNNLSFSPACFSTNPTTFGPIAVMKQYFMTTDCTDISYSKSSHVEFKHVINENKSNVECLNIFYEIVSFTLEDIKICEDADCFIIFFDLENGDSLAELNKILNFLSERCDMSKKIFLISIFTNENNVKSNLNDKNIKYYFSKYLLENYDIQEANIDSLTELAEVIDGVIKEALETKYLIKSSKLDYDKSKSMCEIY